MIVRDDDPNTSKGIICRRCKAKLVANQQTENRCAECDKFAEYGTQQLKRTHNPGSPEPTGSVRHVDRLFLCETHFNSHISN